MEKERYFCVKYSKLFSWIDNLSGPRPPRPWDFGITQRQTTFSTTPLEEWSASRSDRYKTTHTKLTRDTHPCSRRDSNPQSKKVSCHKRTSYTAWPLGSAIHSLPQLIPATTLIALMKSAEYVVLTTSVDVLVLSESTYCERKVEDVLPKCVKLSLIVNYYFLVSRSWLVGFIIHTRPSWYLYCKRIVWTWRAKLPLVLCDSCLLNGASHCVPFLIFFAL